MWGYALCGGNTTVMERAQQFFDKVDRGRAGAKPLPYNRAVAGERGASRRVRNVLRAAIATGLHASPADAEKFDFVVDAFEASCTCR